MIPCILSKKWSVFLVFQVCVKPFVCLKKKPQNTCKCLRPKGWLSWPVWKYYLYHLFCLSCFHSHKPIFIPRTPCQPSLLPFAWNKPGTRGHMQLKNQLGHLCLSVKFFFKYSFQVMLLNLHSFWHSLSMQSQWIRPFNNVAFFFLKVFLIKNKY